MKITIDTEYTDGQVNYDLDHMVKMATSLVADEIASQIRDQVNVMVAEKVRAMTGELTREKLSPLVDEVLEEGFPRTDTYGAVTASNVTLPEFIRKQMTHRNHGRSWLEDKVKSATEEVWKNQCRAVMATAKTQLIQAIDDRIGKEIGKAVRAAVKDT